MGDVDHAKSVQERQGSSMAHPGAAIYKQHADWAAAGDNDRRKLVNLSTNSSSDNLIVQCDVIDMNLRLAVDRGRNTASMMSNQVVGRRTRFRRL